MSDTDLMGKETYETIYKHYSSNGYLIDDFEDVLYCEDKDISPERIKKLKTFLKPVATAKETLAPLESAKLLAAWGVSEAIDYFEYCIDHRIDKLGNLSPHRLHGYDTTYEEITEALLNYYARLADRSEQDGKDASNRIKASLKNIILLSLEIPYDMTGLIKTLKRKNWREYEPELKKCFEEFINRPKNDINKQLNAVSLKKLLMEWDPDFVNKHPRT